MSTKLKGLNEAVGAVSKEIRSYLDSDARKNVSDKHNDAKLRELEARHDAAAAELDAEVRQLARESGKAPVLSRSESRDVDSFDLGRVLRHMKNAQAGRFTQPLDGVEAELTQEGEKEARSAGIEVTGIVLPRLLVRRGGFERRDMTATGTTVTATPYDQGGMTIQTNKIGLADAFYNASVVRQAGATVLEGLVGNLDLPRYVAGTAGAKKAENAAADETSPTTAKLSLIPRRLPCFVDLSDQLLKQSNVAIEAIVRKNIVEQMLAVQEAAFFHGGGTSEPTGIAATSGIGSVVGGTNGAAPDWNDIVDLETEVAIDNALLGNVHYITNSKVRGKLKKTVRVASTDSRFIWDGNDLNGYAPLVTNAVSSALTKGSSNVASAIFFGNWSDFIIAYWGGTQLELIRDGTSAKAGQSILVANSYYDGGVLRPVSFAAMLDALTA